MALEDLLKDTSKPDPDNKNYFLVTITDLKLNQTYPVQFRWKYNDGTFGIWSTVRNMTTPGPTVPNEPELRTTDIVGGAGFIKITWSGKDSLGNTLQNLDRVDIYIAGGVFGDGSKPADSFKVAGTKTITAPSTGSAATTNPDGTTVSNLSAGTYIVQLKAVTVNGSTSFFSTARTVTVLPTGEVIQTPTKPSGLTVTSAPFAVSVNWPGTYYSSTSFTGFKSIDIYAVSSDLGSTATSGISDTNLVASLTVNDIPNKVNIGLDNLRQALSLSTNSDAYTSNIFFYYISVNKDGTKYGSPTYTRINSSSVNPTKANLVDLTSGLISIENLVAGNGQFAEYMRVGGSASGGARIEISGTSDFTPSGATYAVKKGITAYSSGNTELFRLNIGNSPSLTMTGKLTATEIATSSGKFAVNTSGIVTATDVNLTGTVNATGGNIGGLIIASDAIQNGSTSGNSTFRLDNTGKARFGSTNGSSIIIDPTGNIYHSPNGGASVGNFQISGGNVTISGTLTAASGSSIGGWTTTSDTITGGSTTLNSNGTITVSGGSATTTISNSGLLSITNLSSGVAGISLNNGTAYLLSDSLKLNRATIFESAGTANTPAGSLTFSTSNSAREIHFFDVNDLSGAVKVNQGFYYPGHTTTSSTANTYMNPTSGYVARSTASSQRYKENIVNLDTVSNLNPEPLLSLPIRAFKYKSDYLSSEDIRSGILVPGFIAEEMEEYYPAAVDYNDDGLPERWNSDFLIPGMLALIQQLSARLDALEG
jgi:hypothetical protein